MKLQVDDVMPVAKRYIEQPGNSMGGSLHIVLEDLNTENHHVEYCITHAALHNDKLGAALAALILCLSRTQRLKLCHSIWE